MTQQHLSEQYMALPLEAQRQVDEFIAVLRQQYPTIPQSEFAPPQTSHLPQGIAGRALMRFAGTIETRDLKDMEQAIEEGCERIDGDEW